MRYRFIQAEKANDYPLFLLCRVMGVSRKGYYSWLKRGESEPRDHGELDQAIEKLHKESNRTYGTRRQCAELAKMGFRVGRETIRTRMRIRGLKVRYPKAFRLTTKADRDAEFAPNLLDRQFSVDSPNKVWTTDITYVRTCNGFLYLAVMIDLFSRTVVGWSVQERMTANLVIDALQMGLSRREVEPGLIVHSDRGCQYTSTAFRSACSKAGIVQSMSRKGNCWDNAVAESFFSTLKKELLDEGRGWTPGRSKLAIFTYIEAHYNRRRPHSTLAYESPAEFERRVLSKTKLPKAA